MGTYSGTALQQPATPSELLRVGLETDPTGLALVSARTRMTWEQLDELSGRLAAGYLDSGLEPGDRIASLMPNRYELIVHYLACFKAGLVATPLNYRYTAPEIDHALGISEARMLLAHVEREEDLAASERVALLPLGTIRYREPEHGGAAFQELLERDRPGAAPEAPAPTAPAVIFFTSGSTGPPKGVTHTHSSLGWMFAIAAAGLEFGPGDLVLAGSSLSHVGAFYVSFGALSAGAGIAVARTFDGDELLALLRDDRPTVLSMLPSALFALTRDHGATPDDFSSLRLCRAAGDKVSAELEREFTEAQRVRDRRGVRVVGDRAREREPARRHQDRIGRPGRARPLALDSERCRRCRRGRRRGSCMDQDRRSLRRLLGRLRGDGCRVRRRLARHGRRPACGPRRLPLLRGSPEADHRARRLEHQPAGDRGRPAGASVRRQRRASSESATRSTARTSARTSRCARAASGRPTSS